VRFFVRFYKSARRIGEKKVKNSQLREIWDKLHRKVNTMCDIGRICTKYSGAEMVFDNTQVLVRIENITFLNNGKLKIVDCVMVTTGR
jgi:hypothetical protein